MPMALCAKHPSTPIDPTCQDHVAITRNGSAMPFSGFQKTGEITKHVVRPVVHGPPMITEKQMAVSTVWIVKTIFVCPFTRGGTRELLGYGPPAEGAPRFWAELGNIEDSQWHDVHIVLDGTNARVTFDGVEVINATVPAFEYKGGFLGFTGGSGAIGNYHRFDELKVKGTCVYTGPTE